MRKKLTLAKRNDYDFRDIHAVIFDWSDPSDWLKVGITIRNAILVRYGFREDKETYNKLMSYFHRHLAAKGGRYHDHVKFLKDLGYDYEQPKNAVYKFSSS